MFTGVFPGGVWWTTARTSASSSAAPWTGSHTATREIPGSTRWTFYVDPVSGGFVIGDDGDFVRCTPGIAAAVNAVCTEKGTIPGLEYFGAGASPTHLTEFVTRDEERRADAALRPCRGVDFDDYERECSWDTAGNPTMRVTVWSGGVEEAQTVPRI